MPTTSRNSLPYPSMSDAPNGPGAFQALAQAVDPLLNRAIICTSSSRPSSPLAGMLIYETDTGLVLVYSAGWVVIGSSGAIATGAKHYATGVQSIGSNAVISFPTSLYTSPLVTKATSGTGHSFTLNRGGRWGLSTTVRYVASNVEGYAGLFVGSTILAASGNSGAAPNTVNVSIIQRFTAGTAVTVNGFSGATRNTSPSADGGWVNFAAEWLGP